MEAQVADTFVYRSFTLDHCPVDFDKRASFDEEAYTFKTEGGYNVCVSKLTPEEHELIKQQYHKEKGAEIALYKELELKKRALEEEKAALVAERNRRVSASTFDPIKAYSSRHVKPICYPYDERYVGLANFFGLTKKGNLELTEVFEQQIKDTERMSVTKHGEHRSYTLKSTDVLAQYLAKHPETTKCDLSACTVIESAEAFFAQIPQSALKEVIISAKLEDSELKILAEAVQRQKEKREKIDLKVTFKNQAGKVTETGKRYKKMTSTSLFSRWIH